jgi:ADP-heptose:LPS heptosyltransferase
MANLFYKIFDKKRYYEQRTAEKNRAKHLRYFEIIRPRLKLISDNIKKKNSISFLHSGHLGDIINSLPLIKEISKTKKCILHIQSNKKIINNLEKNHPFGNLYLNSNAVKKLIPLLKEQKYLENVYEYKKTPVDVDLDFFRDLGLNFNIDSVRWYFHLAGIHCDLIDPYILVEKHKSISNKIIILRSLRRQNKFINYNFLNNYKNLLFIGLKEEYISLRRDLPSLDYYNSENFLELAQIISGCKLFIGNLSFGYALAEAIKVPRLLESQPDFPLVYPNGKNAYDFYFQDHFEKLFAELIKI